MSGVTAKLLEEGHHDQAAPVAVPALVLPPMSTGASVGQPTPQACVPCRKKHKRCDGKLPCEKCTRIGRPEQCTYATPKRRGPKPMENIYKYCNRLQEELEAQKQISEYWKSQFLAMSQRSEENSSANQALNAGHLPAGSAPSPHFAAVMPPAAAEDFEFAWQPEEHSTSSEVIPQQGGIPDLTLNRAIEFCRASLWDLSPFMPEIDTAPPSPTLLVELWNLSPAQLQQMWVSNPPRLAVLLGQAVVGLIGATVMGFPQYAFLFMQKAECIVNLLGSNNLEKIEKDLAHSVAASVLLMWLYFLNDQHSTEKANLILLVFDIISRHRERISPNLILRAHLGRLGVCGSAADAKFWYSQVMAIGDIHDGGEPSLILFGVATVLYSICLVRQHPADPSSTEAQSQSQQQLRASGPELLDAEQRLSMLELLIERGVVVAVKYPDLSQLLEDNMMTVRLTALATRAAIFVALQQPQEAKRLLEATCLAAQLMRPNLHLYLYGVYIALEAAIVLQSVEHVRRLFSILNSSRRSLPVLEVIKQRASDFLESVPQQAAFNVPLSIATPQQLASPDYRMLLMTSVRSLAGPSQPGVPQMLSQTRLDAELARTEIVVRRFQESRIRVMGIFEAELQSLGIAPPQQQQQQQQQNEQARASSPFGGLAFSFI